MAITINMSIFYFSSGRDLERGPYGGTWIGASKDGRFAVLTNYRKPVDEPPLKDARSRGITRILNYKYSNTINYFSLMGVRGFRSYSF